MSDETARSARDARLDFHIAYMVKLVQPYSHIATERLWAARKRLNELDPGASRWPYGGGLGRFSPILLDWYLLPDDDKDFCLRAYETSPDETTPDEHKKRRRDYRAYQWWRLGLWFSDHPEVPFIVSLIVVAVLIISRCRGW